MYVGVRVTYLWPQWYVGFELWGGVYPVYVYPALKMPVHTYTIIYISPQSLALLITPPSSLLPLNTPSQLTSPS